MDQNLEDIDSLSLVRFAMGGPVGQMPAAEPVAFDGPLSMADGGLVDINSLSVAAFAEGGEVEEKAYTEREVEQMRAAMAQSQADKEPKSPTQQAVKRIAPRATAQGPQQKSSLARQQLYALPPYPLDMSGKLGQAGPIRRAEGSPEYGEIAEQMTVGTPLPTDQGPSLASQGLNLLKQAGQTVYGNLREAVTDPVAFNKRALGNVAQQLQSDPQEFIMNWTGGGLGGIIRPKGGGNLLAGDVEKAIEPLRITAQYQGDKYASDYLNELKKQYGTLPEAKTGYAKTLVQEAALDDWIKNKFGNYIKKQMGTEDDPIRKLADEMSAKVQADYQAGLKRIAKMKDDIAKAKAKGKGTEASEAALADEIEKVEEAFQSTSILPIQLGPYTHVNASIGRAREKAGMSPFEIAKSSQGKSYEELADAPFAPTTKKEIDARIKTGETMGGSWAPDAPKLTENPWLAKLGEEDLVYRIRPLEINEKEIFTHTIDELRNALNPNSGLPPNLLLKPEDMQGLGIEKAFRHVNNINDWRAQQRVAASLADAERSATTIKEYTDTPKKLKWQQLKPAEYTELPPGYSVTSSYEGPALFGPDGKKLTTFSPDSDIPVQQQALNFIAKNDLEKALQYEGSTMRHCVGGYCDDVWSGQTNIFSLRDKKGEPHVTIETAPADIRRTGNTPRDFIDSLDEESYTNLLNKYGFKPDEMDTIFNLNNDLNMILANRKIISTPEFQEWLRNKPAEILQIKGKGNAKPKEEYIPFVQDFIRSQKWSAIGDRANADLVFLKDKMKESLEAKGIKVNIEPSLESIGSYVTKQEFNRLADLLGGVNKYD
ncbi:PcfJ-like protein [Phage DSL-LC04]|nr:PcfJ-like protein [Phage DSL-LC04]